MFNPGLIGLEVAGLHEIVYSTIMKCDVDIRKDLYGNVVLAGGNTMFPGMAERLREELVLLAVIAGKEKMVAIGNEETYMFASHCTALHRAILKILSCLVLIFFVLNIPS